jgi:hypothetical protein
MSLPILGVIDAHQHYRRTAILKLVQWSHREVLSQRVRDRAGQRTEPQRERARALNRSKPAQGQAGVQDRERFEGLKTLALSIAFLSLYVRDGPRLRINGLTIGIHFPER